MEIMNWYKLHKIAQARYGAWIAPGGRIYDVPSNRGHDEVAIDILKAEFGFDPANPQEMISLVERLMDLGYVRFIYVPFGAEARIALTDTQKVKLMEFANISESYKFSFSSRPKKIELTVTDVISARELIRKM